MTVYPHQMHCKQTSNCTDILMNKVIIGLILPSFGPFINHAMELNSLLNKTSIHTKGIIAISNRLQLIPQSPSIRQQKKSTKLQLLFQKALQLKPYCPSKQT